MELHKEIKNVKNGNYMVNVWLLLPLYLNLCKRQRTVETKIVNYIAEVITYG